MKKLVFRGSSDYYCRIILEIFKTLLLQQTGAIIYTVYFETRNEICVFDFINFFSW